ncbi:MAG: ABC transporter substrate-binding protein, partial [Pseudomonadota bacterium]
TFNVDLLDLVQPVYGAPPLLAEEMRSGRIDAVLNFWNYTARLEGAGFKTLIGMADVMAGLGVAPPPPLVGFVWTTRFERSNPGAVSGLLAAVADANNLLARDDAAWEKVRPGMRAKSEAEFKALRATYRAGIPEPWTGAYTASAAALLELLSSLGQKDLIGAKTRFDPKLFNGTS